MNLDPTLGEILADVLTADHSPPLSFVEQVILETIVETAKADAERLTQRALFASGSRIADDLAPLLGKPVSEIFDVLGTMPSEMLALLDTPQGWEALAVYVAGHFGVAAPNYSPAIN